MVSFTVALHKVLAFLGMHALAACPHWIGMQPKPNGPYIEGVFLDPSAFIYDLERKYRCCQCGAESWR